MGRMILCTSRRAENPYIFPVSDTQIYTVEELCCYIYHNIFEMTEECFGKKLTDWFRNELGMEVIASKLEILDENQGTIKDRIISIMCSCDYYTEQDIKALLTIISEIENLPYHGKLKLKADNYLKFGKYSAARKEYDRILTGGYVVNLNPLQYGNILHNRSMACFYMGSFAEALSGFKEAYSRNNNPESIKHYLYGLLLDGENDTFREEAEKYGISEEDMSELVNDVSRAFVDAAQSKNYMDMAKELRYGDKNEIHKKAGKRLDIIKEQYKSIR